MLGTPPLTHIIDYESLALNSIITNGDLEEVAKLKLYLPFFSQENKNLVTWLIKKTFDFHKIPDALTTVQEFPVFIQREAPESPAFYLALVRERHTFNSLRETAVAIETSLMARKPQGGIDSLRRWLRDHDDFNPDAKKTTLETSYDNVRIDYYKQKFGKGDVGIPFGWGSLDDATMGALPGEFVVFLANAGVGKTWVSGDMAVNSYRLGHRPLYVTCEMSERQMCRRLASIHAQVSFERLKKGCLTQYDEERLDAAIKDFKDFDDLFVLSGIGMEGGGGVSLIQSYIDKVKPDCVYVDNFYLLDAEDSKLRGWEAVDSIARSLKRLCLSANLPIIATAQLSTEGDNAAYSKRIKHHADMMFKLDRDPSILGGSCGVSSMKVRESPPVSFLFKWSLDPVDFPEIAGANTQIPQDEVPDF